MVGYFCTAMDCGRMFTDHKDWIRHENGNRFHREIFRCDQPVVDVDPPPPSPATTSTAAAAAAAAANNNSSTTTPMLCDIFRTACVHDLGRKPGFI